MSKSCSTCTHSALGWDRDGKVNFKGPRICRRYPPTPMLLPAGPQGQPGVFALFPEIAPNQLCGEWAARDSEESAIIGQPEKPDA